MIIYTVKRGETESDVAKRFNISMQTLMGDNGLVSRLSITEGQNLLIRESNDQRVGKIKAMASVKPQIKADTANEIMPHLTYASVRACFLRSDGSIIMQNDSDVRELLKKHRVAPVLEVQRAVSVNDPWWDVVADVSSILRAAQNVKQAVLSNGYTGVNFNLGRIPSEAFEGYFEFIATVKEMLSPWEKIVVSSASEDTIITEDVEVLSDCADLLAIFPKSPGHDIVDVLEIEDLLRLALDVTNPDKISLCVPMTAVDRVYSPDGKLIREEGLSTSQATRLAMERKAVISYDETRCLSEYDYLDLERGSIVRHSVELEDLEGLYEILCMGRELGVTAINIFNSDK